MGFIYGRKHICCNLHPLLNGGTLKNSQMAIEPNMVYFQTYFEKYALPRARQRPGGAAGGGARGIFLKICFKIDRIFKHLFENGPYLGHPIFKISIGLVYRNLTI